MVSLGQCDLASYILTESILFKKKGYHDFKYWFDPIYPNYVNLGQHDIIKHTLVSVVKLGILTYWH